MGVCRACQQLCQERLARARAQEAGSCQPLARAVRGVRTPPNRGSHRLLPHPHKLLGLGIPEDKGGGRRPGGVGWAGGGEGALLSQPLFRAKTLLLASGISPSFKPPPHLELTGQGLGQMGLAPAF